MYIPSQRVMNTQTVHTACRQDKRACIPSGFSLYKNVKVIYVSNAE